MLSNGVLEWRRLFEPAPGAEVNWTIGADAVLRALDWDAAGDIAWSSRIVGVRPLAHALRSLVHGQHRSEAFEIAVLGNSVTGGHDLGANLSTRGDLAWPSRLQAALHGQGYTNVVVNNLARSLGGHSCLAVSTLWREPARAALARARLIVVDYSVSDCAKCCSYPDGMSMPSHHHGVAEVRGAALVDQCTKWLARVLLSQRSRPAVVYLQTFTAHQCTGYTCTSGPISRWDQWPAIASLRLPTISYFDAICPNSTAQSLWNPAPHTRAVPSHENIGRLVASSILLLARAYEHQPLHELPDHPPEARDLSTAECESPPGLLVTMWREKAAGGSGPDTPAAPHMREDGGAVVLSAEHDSDGDVFSHPSGHRSRRQVARVALRAADAADIDAAVVASTNDTASELYIGRFARAPALSDAPRD